MNLDDGDGNNLLSIGSNFFEKLFKASGSFFKEMHKAKLQAFIQMEKRLSQLGRNISSILRHKFQMLKDTFQYLLRRQQGWDNFVKSRKTPGDRKRAKEAEKKDMKEVSKEFETDLAAFKKQLDKETKEARRSVRKQPVQPNSEDSKNPEDPPLL